MTLQNFAYTGNPITEDISDATVSVVRRIRNLADGATSKAVELSAEPFNGVAHFDYAPILRTFFREPVSCGMIEHMQLFRDYRLFCSAVFYMPITAFTYVFVRGVLQQGELPRQSKILSMLWSDSYEHVCFEGYPAIVSMKCEETLVVDSEEGAIRWQMNEPGVYTLEINHECDVDVSIDAGSTAGGFGAHISFVEAPAHPFYIRWINNCGGWDTFMFACNQKNALSLDANLYHDKQGTIGEMESYHKDGKHVIEASSGLVELDTYKLLSMLQFSPLIQRYEPEKGWYNVQIDKCDANWEANQSKKELLVSFVMPSVQINQ